MPFARGFRALKARLAMLAQRSAAQAAPAPAPAAQGFMIVPRPQPTRFPFGRMR